MSRLAAAVEDPAIAERLRTYREASARMTELADRGMFLEERGRDEELHEVERAADEAQRDLGDAARALDEILGDDVLARKLRAAKEDSLKIPARPKLNGTTNGTNGTAHVGRGHGEFKRCVCGGILRGRHREFCKLTRGENPASTTTSTPLDREVEASARLDGDTQISEPSSIATPIPPPTCDAAALCDELKAKLQAREVLAGELRALVARLAQAVGA